MSLAEPREFKVRIGLLPHRLEPPSDLPRPQGAQLAQHRQKKTLPPLVDTLELLPLQVQSEGVAGEAVRAEIREDLSRLPTQAVGPARER
jgi:hypothetical protein